MYTSLEFPLQFFSSAVLSEQAVTKSGFVADVDLGLAQDPDLLETVSFTMFSFAPVSNSMEAP